MWSYARERRKCIIIKIFNFEKELHKFVKMLRQISIAILLLLSPLNVITAFQVEGEHVFNQKDSPVEVSIGSSSLLIKNKADKEIKDVQFGCIQIKNDKLKIKEEGKIITINLGPTEFFLEDVSHGDITYYSDMIKCSEKGGKASIIKVEFIDGTKWIISE
jgi:hypothetical protein